MMMGLRDRACVRPDSVTSASRKLCLGTDPREREREGG